MPEKRTVTNLRTGEEVTVEVPTHEEAYVAALKREREGYARYGRDDMVAGVDAELKRLGVAVEKGRPAPSDVERATAAPGEKRRGRPAKARKDTRE